MTAHQPPRRDPAGGPRLSWQEREIVSALRRLAKARAQVVELEARLAEQARRPAPDPADSALVEELQKEIERVAPRAASRFGAGAARARLAELQRRQREVLARLGFDDYTAYSAAGGGLAPVDDVDPVFVEFARREVRDAEEALAALLALPDDGTDLPGGAAEVPEAPDHPLTIDLRSPEGS
jgi:hypothetical protein